MRLLKTGSAVPSAGVRRVLCGLAVLIATGVLAPVAGAAWPPPEPLSPAGRWIVDADGRVVVLRGVNMVDKRPPYLPASKGFGADDARFLRAAGFSAVRLGMIHKGLEAVRGRYDDAYLEGFVESVRALRAEGLLVVADFHQDYFNERTGGEGFPDWMVQVAGPPTRPDAWPFDALWRNASGFGDAFAAAWERAAARLAREPGIVGYDLLNEPFPGTREQECAQVQGCRSFDERVLTPFFARTAAAARRGDPARMTFVEPHVIFNGGARSWLGAVGPGAGLSFHLYCFERSGLEPCSVRRAWVLDNAEELGKRHGWPLLLSEFGATDRVEENDLIAGEADRRMLSWLHWAYWNHDPFASRPHEGLIRDLALPPEGTNVKEDKLAVLARPYPRAIAGTPLAWSWSAPAREFVARWSPAPVAGVAGLASGAVTEVVLPRFAFPSGWHVAGLAGGEVVESAEPDVLLVRALPGAGEVSVRVVAGRAAAPARRPAAKKKPAARKPRVCTKRTKSGKRRRVRCKPARKRGPTERQTRRESSTPRG